MPPDLMIDGYNLLHFSGFARMRYGPGDLERVRNRLLKRLVKLLTPQEISRTTVVFDGQDTTPGSQQVQQFEGMRVIYSPPSREADDVIEDLIARHGNPRQLVVVSSDNRLIAAIRRRKGTSMTSEFFLDQLAARQEADSDTTPANAAEKPEDFDAVELQQWVTEFGDVTVPESIPEQPDSPSEGSPVAGAIEGIIPAAIPDEQSSLLAELEEELKRCLDEEIG